MWLLQKPPELPFSAVLSFYDSPRSEVSEETESGGRMEREDAQEMHHFATSMKL